MAYKLSESFSLNQVVTKSDLGLAVADCLSKN